MSVTQDGKSCVKELTRIQCKMILNNDARFEGHRLYIPYLWFNSRLKFDNGVGKIEINEEDIEKFPELQYIEIVRLWEKNDKIHEMIMSSDYGSLKI